MTALMDDGEVISVVGIGRDVTPRKRTEEEFHARARILEAVAFAAERFLVGGAGAEDTQDVLKRLATAAKVDRVAVFQNTYAEDGDVIVSELYSWTDPAVPGPETVSPEVHSYRAMGYDRWIEVLGSGGVISGVVRDFPHQERHTLEQEGFRSIAIVPIFMGDEWWGTICYGRKRVELDWSPAEIRVLKTAAGLFGATIHQARSDEALRESEDRYRRLVELSPDAIVIHKKGVIEFANPAALRLVGARQPEDLLGQSVLKFVHPDSRPLVLERLQRLREGRHAPLIGERFVRLDGRAVEVEVAAIPFQHEGETAVQVVARDVTDRLKAEEALRASEDRYRRLVELSPDAIAVHSEGSFVFANRAMANLLGLSSPEDITGTPILDVIHPDSHALVKGLRSRTPPEDAEAPLVEEKFMRRDGTVIDVEVAGIPITYQDQLAWQIVTRDITDRKRAEVSLRQRNAYLAALHETSLAIMDRLDLRESLEAIAARSGALVGTEHGYIYLVDPERDEIVVEVALGAFKDWAGFRMKRGEGIAGKVWDTGQPLAVEDYDSWEGRSPSFQKGVFRAVLGVPLKSAQGVVGVLGVAHIEEGRTFSDAEAELLTQFAALASVALDNARLYTDLQRELSERGRFEHELGQTEAKYRTLVEQIPAISYVDVYDPQYTPDMFRTAYVSPQIETMLGYSPEEFVDNPELWYTLVHPDDRERALAADEKHYRTGEPLTQEYRVVGRDGRTVWVLVEAVVVRDEGGEPRFSQGILYDITSRKKAEEDLERALSIEREAAERLRALDEMKNTFLHAVSHELRTPLSAVLGLALTLEREEVKLSAEERQDLVRRLAANARKLDQLLSDLLDLDRLDRGIMEPRRRPTDVAALVRRTVENSDILGTRPVRVWAQLVVVSVDAPKVERIVENLLANAARHTPPDTTIWVRVLPERGGVVISVEDDGPGVSEELRESIFEPFRQGPDAPRHSPGVGIGLSLVAKFAELHGGRAWVDQRPGGGASFKVFLPGAAA